MSILLSFIWDIDPEIFPFLEGVKIIGNIRWYGILWALSFVSAIFIMQQTYKYTTRDKTELDSLFMYCLIGCIAGARVGHCLFYGPYFDQYGLDGELLNTGYLSRPWTILYVWEGGLASHGAGIGLLVACYFFFKKFNTPNYIWIIDRVALTIALAGCLIRFGNFLNSEIIGKPTDANTAVVFAYDTRSSIEATYPGAVEDISYKAGNSTTTDYEGIPLESKTMTVTFKKGIPTKRKKEDVFAYIKNANEFTSSDRKHFVLNGEDKVIKKGNSYSKIVYPIPRHPSQLYEAISCLFLFALLCFLFFVLYKGHPPTGLMIGLFMVVTFSLRYFYEIFKESQVIERGSWALNTGQLLSIPMVLFGLGCIYYAFTKGKTTNI